MIPDNLDARFREAVAAMDGGDEAALARILGSHPSLVRERLEAPGPWLRDKVGAALDGFFARPFLLWFAAEDPVRNGSLPSNIASITRLIVDVARQQQVDSLQEQLDHALRLVSWSWIARQSNVQIGLIDVLLDAGAHPDGNPENALVNGNVDAATHLIARGAPLRLASALCLRRWDDAERLAQPASAGEKQFALVLAALKGDAEAVARGIRFGADVNAPSSDLYSHGTPVHHAVSSGSLDKVKVLVDAGAALGVKDSVYGGTPLDWADHLEHASIAAYLRSKGAR